MTKQTNNSVLDERVSRECPELIVKAAEAVKSIGKDGMNEKRIKNFISIVRSHTGLSGRRSSGAPFFVALVISAVTDPTNPEFLTGLLKAVSNHDIRMGEFWASDAGKKLIAQWNAEEAAGGTRQQVEGDLPF